MRLGSMNVTTGARIIANPIPVDACTNAETSTTAALMAKAMTVSDTTGSLEREGRTDRCGPVQATVVGGRNRRLEYGDDAPPAHPRRGGSRSTRMRVLRARRMPVVRSHRNRVPAADHRRGGLVPRGSGGRGPISVAAELHQRGP